MNIGVYNAASTMMVKLSEQDLIAHNLANINTPGYRLLRMSFSNFGETFLHLVAGSNGQTPARVPLGVTVNSQKVDTSFGNFRPTGNPLDLAIDGDGWFIVQTPQGLRYTRNGNFSIAPDGTLVTLDGFPVLGQDNRPIVLPRGSKEIVHVSETGEVFVGNQVISRLQLVQFTNLQTLQPVGNGYYIATNPQSTTSARIAQGTLESSNVKPVNEMVRMINNFRIYEMAAKAIQTSSEIGRALLDATRV